MAHGCISDPETEWTWIHANNGTFLAGLKDLVRAPFAFTILRCPYSRLASVFLDKIVSRNMEFWSLFRREWERFDPDELTFRQFIELIQPEDKLSKDIHWCPQVDFLVYEDYDCWFSLSSFSDAAKEITRQTGMKIYDGRGLTLHGTSHLSSISDGCFADMPRWEIAQMKREGRVPASKALYDDALAQIVCDMYRDDIALYREKIGQDSLMFPELMATLKD